MPETNLLAELIERAKTGDEQALERILLDCGPLLTRHIENRFPAKLRRATSEEDILQLTLMQAFTAIGTLKTATKQGFIAWLKSIADMRLVDALRAEMRQKRGGGLQRREVATDSFSGKLVDLMERLPGEDPTASRQVAHEETLLALQVALAGLDSAHRKAIQLHLLDGKSLNETATEMDRSEGAVRGLIQRGKEKLADAMGRASQWMSGR